MDITLAKYESLLDDLKSIQAQTQQKAEAAIQIILARGYWKMGERIAAENLSEPQKKTTFANLAADMTIERTLFSRMLKFYLIWPGECPVLAFPFLSWSHYKVLMGIENEAAREFYLEQAEADGWQVRLLSQKIKDNAYLSFQTHSKKRRTAAADGREAPQLTRRSEALHVYKGDVSRVIDGDTLVLDIDLGFEVWTRKRLRLRGIDTPEMNSPDPVERQRALQAKAFSESRLPAGSTIVIQTFKVDLHGRFVADVFYLPAAEQSDLAGRTDKERVFAEGHFLNQELLDAGLAEMM